MTPTPDNERRSPFVTAVAWVFIVLTGFMTLIALLQNIMIAVMFPQDALNQAPIANGMPAPLRFMLAHPQLLFGGFLVASATALVSSIGLLKRRNWGRLMFIGILILAIAWNLVGLVLTLWSFPLVPPMPEHAPSDLTGGFRTMWIAMIVVSVAIALAVSVLLGWLAKRLASPEIKREFVSG